MPASYSNPPLAIPTEPIGSVPRSPELLAAIEAKNSGTISDEELAQRFDLAVKDTVRRFLLTGSPVITDGEQSKSSFATYPLEGMDGLSGDGVVIEFADGHTRQLPRLTKGPFRYRKYADTYLKAAKSISSVPVKQAVISASALSLIYQSSIPGYSREQFTADLIREAESDIRRCLAAGAHCVQIDFTEGRLSLKLDPRGSLLKAFVDLNNQVLGRFSEDELANIGVHSCPGGDNDATHSASVDYESLLPALFTLRARRFYIQLASEPDRPRVLRAIKSHLKPNQIVFVGVIDPINSRVETPEEVQERVIEAASYIPIEQFGTTDDCGFSPFADDVSTSRDTAFAKIAARVAGTRMAERSLGLA